MTLLLASALGAELSVDLHAWTREADLVFVASPKCEAATLTDTGPADEPRMATRTCRFDASRMTVLRGEPREVTFYADPAVSDANRGDPTTRYPFVDRRTYLVFAKLTDDGIAHVLGSGAKKSVLLRKTTEAGDFAFWTGSRALGRDLGGGRLAVVNLAAGAHEALAPVPDDLDARAEAIRANEARNLSGAALSTWDDVLTLVRAEAGP